MTAPERANETAYFAGKGSIETFDYRQVTRYEASQEIVMGRGAKPADDRRAFDARDVTTRLGPSIIRPR